MQGHVQKMTIRSPKKAGYLGLRHSLQQTAVACSTWHVKATEASLLQRMKTKLQSSMKNRCTVASRCVEVLFQQIKLQSEDTSSLHNQSLVTATQRPLEKRRQNAFAGSNVFTEPTIEVPSGIVWPCHRVHQRTTWQDTHEKSIT